jgi:transcriptional regulator with XRE-family HTH domain
MTEKIDYGIANAEQITKDLGEKIEKERLSRGITLTDLASASGLTRKTLYRIVHGESTSLDSFIRVLIALGIQDRLDYLIPEISIHPMEMVTRFNKPKIGGKSRRKNNKLQSGKWVWGDQVEAGESNV